MISLNYRRSLPIQSRDAKINFLYLGVYVAESEIVVRSSRYDENYMMRRSTLISEILPTKASVSFSKLVT